MALRAVIFDYGMVLTGPQDPESHAALLRISNLPMERFEELYWVNRHAYDEGKLTGLAFWQKFAESSGIHASSNDSEALVAQLNELDARMWTTQNPAMLAWQLKLKESGFLTAILSNMGDSVLENMKREFDWLPRFDVLIWSYQLLMAKPDPAIYLHILKELGVRPEEALFLDDKLINIEAAHSLGIKAIQFSTVEKLREDLVAHGFDSELPLP